MVTVNVSREGRSRERFSYVVSACLLSVPLVIPVPLRVSVQLPMPSQLVEKQDLQLHVGVLEEVLSVPSPVVTCVGCGRTAAGSWQHSHAPRPSSCRGLSHPSPTDYSPAIKRSSVFIYLFC